MYIAPDARKNIFFVGFNSNDGQKWDGTGFLTGTPAVDPGQAFHYLVTAKHVIEQIARGAADGKVLIRINMIDGTAETFETHLDQWKFHPEDSSVDAAVAPVALGNRIDLKALPLALMRHNNLPSWIEPGTDIFFPGMFYRHVGATQNQALVRTGSVAAFPKERIFIEHGGSMEAYLVEARSIGGSSGSPVFAQRETPTGRFSLDFEVYWIGLLLGHYKSPARTRREEAGDLFEEAWINMGIAIVVPAKKILEIIDGPDFRPARLAAGAPK